MDLSPLERKILIKIRRASKLHFRSLSPAKAIVAKLVARGLVERIVNDKAGKPTWLRLTAAGWDAVAVEPAPLGEYVTIPAPCND